MTFSQNIIARSPNKIFNSIYNILMSFDDISFAVYNITQAEERILITFYPVSYSNQIIFFASDFIFHSPNSVARTLQNIDLCVRRQLYFRET